MLQFEYSKAKRATLSMQKKPPIAELDFIKMTANHAEFSRKLALLHLESEVVAQYAHHVASCWYGLAVEHMEDAKHAHRHNRTRAAYSRSYYAAYNASKAIRYAVSGQVSLKGEDHGRAATTLPQDLPDVAHWSQIITKLYECRLYADYDNWSDSPSMLPMESGEAVQAASCFLQAVKTYASEKLGLAL